MPLTLRRARDGRASAGTPDDYDVLSGDRAMAASTRQGRLIGIRLPCSDCS
jgi:hypothetical protein